MTGDHHSRLVAEIRTAVPRASGVYAFTGEGGRLLYVGKSVNLRRRMVTYLQRDPLSTEPPLGRLAASIWSFAWWQTRSELLALLLEDVLIKQHLPPYNTRQRDFGENRYLELTRDAFPACMIAEHVRDFGAREVYGPFRDKYAAGTMRDILHRITGIRICTEPEPARRCLEFDIGRCAGPCRGMVGTEEYGSLVAEARVFLSGESDMIVRRLIEARDRSAAAMHYEDAAKLRDAVRVCRGYFSNRAFARSFEEGDCALVDTEDGLEYRFSRGALVMPGAVIVASGEGGLGQPSGPGGLCPSPDPAGIRPAPDPAGIRPAPDPAGIRPAPDPAGPRPAPEATAFHPKDAGRQAVALLRESPLSDPRFLADRARIVHGWSRSVASRRASTESCSQARCRTSPLR